MTNWILFIFTALLIFIAYAILSVRKMKNMPLVDDHTKIRQLNDQNFNQQIKNGMVLVDFWASWCAPCKMMAPVLNQVADELPENKTVGKLNVEISKAVSSKYNIRNIPTMILFNNGKEINRFVGIKSKEFLLKEMSKI